LLGALCSVFSLVKLICANDGVRLGLTISIFCNSLAAVFVPGRIFPLCKIAQMRCHLVMKPAVFAVGVLLCALCLIDAVLLFKKVYAKERK